MTERSVKFSSLEDNGGTDSDARVLVAQAETGVNEDTPPEDVTVTIGPDLVARLPEGTDISNPQVVGADIHFIQPDGSVVIVLGGAVSGLTLFVGAIEIPADTVSILLGNAGIDTAAGPNSPTTLSSHGVYIQPTPGPLDGSGDGNGLLGGENGLGVLSNTELDVPTGGSGAEAGAAANTPPVIASGLFLGTMSEEAYGNPDTLGDSDLTDLRATGGSITVSDTDPVTFAFGIPAIALTSAGVEVVWTANGGTLIGTANGETVLTGTITDGGDYVFVLSAPLDHPVAGTEDVISFSVPVTVTDTGNLTAETTIDLSVEDDMPIVATAESVTVEDEALDAGNDEDDGFSASATGDLNISWGADDANSGAGLPGDRSVIFTSADVAVTGAFGAGLTASGETVSTIILADGTLIGYIGGTAPSDVADKSVVFSVVLSDMESGSYTFNLFQSLDHAAGGGEAPLDLAFSVTATDADGDAVAHGFSVAIADDMPVASKVKAASVDEDAIGRGVKTRDGGATTATASGSLEISWGADDAYGGLGQPGDRSVVFTSAEIGLVGGYGDTLTSLGRAVSTIILADGTLIGFVGDAAPNTSTDPDVVFAVSLSDQNEGTFSFSLLQPLDHATGNDDTALALTFSATATDSDGDSIAQSFAVNVIDGVPTASGLLGTQVEDEALGGNDEADGLSAAVSGDLGISWGPDSANDGDGQPGDRSIAFSSAGVTVQNAYGTALSSLGRAVSTTILDDGTLVGYVGDIAPTAITDSDVVFHVGLDDTGSGSYTFTLVRPLDHAAGNGEDPLSLTFAVTAMDSDGDAVSQSFAVDIVDDVPVIAGSTTSDIYASGTVDIPIPADGSTGGSSSLPTHSIIYVPDGGSIADLNVSINLTHTFMADLEIYLVAPNGTQVELINDEGGNGDPDGTITLDDEADAYFSDASAPFTGTWRPTDGALSGFDGLDSSGTWTLIINDDASRDTGLLRDWSLEITREGTGAGAILDEDGLTSGNAGDAYDDGDADGETVSATASLNIAWGADSANSAEDSGQSSGAGDRAVTFADLTSAVANISIAGTVDPAALTSHDDAITYAFANDGATLIATAAAGTADAREVFRVVLSDQESGSFTVTLKDTLDHPVANSEDSLTFTFAFTATDSDGDTIGSSFAVEINDDGPTAAEFVLAETVLDDDVFSGNADGTGDVADAATVTGSAGTLFAAGADGAKSGSVSIAQAFQVVVVDTDGVATREDVSIGNPEVDGTTTTWTLSSTSIAKVGTLSVTADGAYSFTLFAPLAQPLGQTSEDNLRLAFDYTIVDVDGDTVSGQLQIDVNDDTPVSTGTVQSLTVFENETAAGTDSGNSDDKSSDAETNDAIATGNAAALVEFGADGRAQAAFALSTDALAASLTGLKSGGVALTFAVANNTLTATAGQGGAPVFTFALDARSGDYTYTQLGPLDHSGDASKLSLDLSSAIVVTDGDGDTLALTGQIAVSVIDDIPTASADAKTLLEDGSVAGSVAGLVDAGADGLAASDPYAVSTGPAHGSINLNAATGAYTYTPNADYFGSDSFTYSVTDADGDSVTNTVSLTVTPVNDQPGFVSPSAADAVDEDAGAISVANFLTSISVGPANESDQTIAFTVTGNSNAGLFAVAPSIAPDGTLTYTPADNANGTATITVTAQDSGGTENGGDDTSVTHTFTITVNPVNDAPTATNSTQSVSLDEDGDATALFPNTPVITDIDSASVTATLTIATEAGVLTGADSSTVDGDNTVYTITGSPAEVTAALALVTYDSAADFSGAASVAFAVSDGENGPQGTNPSGVISITVNPVTDTPTVAASNAIGNEDQSGGIALTITAAVTDLVGDSETITGITISGVENGRLSAGADTGNGVWTLTEAQLAGLAFLPDENFDGTVNLSVTATAQDGSADPGTSAAQSFAVTVLPVSDAPELAITPASGDEDTAIALSIAPALSDADETITSVTISGIPAGSVLSDGSHSFTATDSITSVNVLGWTLSSLTITPAQDFNGAFNLSVAATSRDDTVTPATTTETLAVTVTPVNDAPQLSAPQPSAPQLGAPQNIAIVNADFEADKSYDWEGDTMRQTSRSPQGWSGSGPAYGWLDPWPNGEGGNASVLSMAAKNGANTMFLNTNSSMSQTLSETAQAGMYELSVEIADRIDLGGGMPSYALRLFAGDTLLGESITPAAAAGPEWQTAELSVTVPVGAAGIGEALRIEFANLGSGGPQVNFDNVALSFAEALVDSVSEDAHEDGATVSIDLSAYGDDVDADDDGTTLIYTVTGDPTEGTASINGTTLTFDPGSDFQDLAEGETRDVTIEVTATDSHGASAVDTLTITVIGTNDAPKVAPASAGISETNATLAGSGTLTVSDADTTDIVSLSVTGVSTGGTYAGTLTGIDFAGMLTLAANPVLGSGQSSADIAWTFSSNGEAFDFLAEGETLIVTYAVTPTDDSGTTSATGSAGNLVITITGTNDAPVATADAYATSEDGTLVVDAGNGILANDTDVEGDAISFTQVTNPAHGTVLFGTDGNFEYTPDTEFSGTDTFTYRPTDGADIGDAVTVTIDVAPKADGVGIVAENTTLSGAEGGTITIGQIGFTFVDTDGSESVTRLVLSGFPAGATFSVGAAGTGGEFGKWVISDADQIAGLRTGALSMTPPADYFGSFSLTVTATTTDSATYASGATASDSVETSTEIAVSVSEINDAPVASDDTLSAVNEDSGVRIISIASLLANDTRGPANEDGQTLTLTSIVDAVGGTAVINGENIEFTLTPDFKGTASFDYTIRDNGTTNGADDFKSATARASFTVNSVNDAPTYSAPDSVTSVDEDSGKVTVTGFVSAISPGPADESGQTVGFTITGNTNPSLFDGAVTISSDGTLVYTPAENAYGTAEITFVAIDNGGTANTGTNTSVAHTFTITVDPVNDAPTFSVVGESTASLDLGENDTANGTLVLEDGRIVVVGNSDQDFVIMRLNANGTFDSSFGTDGIATPVDVADVDRALDVIELENGQYLVSGSTLKDGRWTGVLMRYNADGTLDTDFGTDGVKTYNYGTQGHFSPGNLAIVADAGDPAGYNIVVGGNINGHGTFDQFALFRFNSDGSPDTDFSANGTVLTNFPGQGSVGRNLLVDENGKIVMTGDGGNGLFGVMRFDTNGALDTSFGGTGQVTSATPSIGAARAYASMLGPDGTILVAGYARTSTAEYILKIVSYNSDGSLTSGFGENGVLTYNYVLGEETPSYMAAHTRTINGTPETGFIVAGSHADGSGGVDFFMVRFNADGSVDTGFGTNGVVSYDVGLYDSISAIDIQPDGRIVAVGAVQDNSNSSFSIVRFNADGTFDETFNSASAFGGTAAYTEDGLAVVIDPNAFVFDQELSTSNDFGGAVLTLTRDGGSSAEDVFGRSGALGALDQGAAVTVSGVTVGTVTTNSGGTLVITFASGATQAQVNAAMSAITYANSSDTPPASVTLKWTFDDGNAGAQGSGGNLSVTATTLVEIAATNDAPQFTDGGNVIADNTVYQTQIAENTTEVASPGSIDPDGAAPQYTLVETAGTDFALFDIDPGTGALRFKVAPDFEHANDQGGNNVYVVDVRVFDGYDGFDIQRVEVTVTDVVENIAPVANADSYLGVLGATEDKVLTVNAENGVLANDTDADSGDVLRAIVVSSTGHGSLNLSADGAFTYTPDENFSGQDSFTYKVNDGTEDGNTETVTIDVRPVADGADLSIDSNTTSQLSLVSTSANGTQGNDSSIYGVSVSADGTKIAFSSTATNLIGSDANSVADIFVKDLISGDVQLVSAAADGTQGDAASKNAVSISADGTKVAFISSAANLVSSDTNGVQDIFVKDLETGAIERVSVAPDGNDGNGQTLYSVAISADGTKVAFASHASNLVAGDSNTQLDVFVRDLNTGTTQRVSVDEHGVEGNYAAGKHIALSANGTKVAFISSATNLVSNDTNGHRDVFVKDLETGAIERISVSSDGTEANSFSDYGLSMSADGTKVAFVSYASNLVDGDTNGRYDVFVKDLETGAIERISVASDGTEANSDSVYGVSMSADGTKVAFASYASNLVADDNNGTIDVFIKNLLTGEITRLSQDASGHGVYNGAGFGSPDIPELSMSADGNTVAFLSEANNLVPNDQNGHYDYFAAKVDNGRIVAEDTAYTLPKIALTDGSETITSVILSGYPEGARFSAGHQDGTTWVFDQQSDIAVLTAGTVTLTPPADYNGSFAITVTANVADTATLSSGEVTDSISTTRAYDITVTPVNDAPQLGAPQNIAIVNADFEADTSYGVTTSTSRYSNGAPQGWSGAGGYYGWQDPLPGGAGGNDAIFPMAEQNGANTMWLNSGAIASQTLSDAARAGTYELSLEVADHHGLAGLPSYALRLFAGDTLLGENITPSLGTNGPYWKTAELSVTVPVGATGIGEALRIEFANLGGNGEQLNFDNVALSFAEALVDSVSEDAPVHVLDLLAGAFDPDGDDLSAIDITVTDDQNNAVAFTENGDGTISINPNDFSSLGVGESRTITVSYNVSDGMATTGNTATLVVTGVGGAVVATTPASVSASLVASLPAAGAGMAVDTETGNIYVAEATTSATLYKVTPSGTVSVIASDITNTSSGGGIYPHYATDIEFHGGKVYVVSGTGILTSIDVATGTKTQLQTLPDIGNEAGLDISQDGTIFVTDGVSSSDDVWAYDIATGQATKLVDSGITTYRGAEFDEATGRLFVKDSSGAIFAIDSDTGGYQRVFTGVPGSNYAILPGGTEAFARIDGSILRFDTDGNQFGLIGGLQNAGSSDLEFGPSTTGSTYSLFFINNNYLMEIPGFSIRYKGAADPVIIDLLGDGLDASTAVAFDLDHDGTPNNIAWPGAGDGLLVADLDGSGMIEDGSEVVSPALGGGNYADSLEALATFDSNGDGKVTAEDTGFQTLKVWSDTNSDGVSDAGELHGLSDLGIVEIDLGTEDVDFDAGGQHAFAKGSVLFEDGSRTDYFGVDLAAAPDTPSMTGTDGADSFVLTDIEVTEVIADYDQAQGDIIDLSALLENVAPTEQTDAVRYVGNELQVDADGVGTKHDFVTVADMAGNPPSLTIIVDDGTQVTVDQT